MGDGHTPCVKGVQGWSWVAVVSDNTMNVGGFNSCFE